MTKFPFMLGTIFILVCAFVLLQGYPFTGATHIEIGPGYQAPELGDGYEEFTTDNYTSPEVGDGYEEFTTDNYTSPETGDGYEEFTTDDYTSPETGDGYEEFTTDNYTSPETSDGYEEFTTDNYISPDFGDGFIVFTDDDFYSPDSDKETVSVVVGPGFAQVEVGEGLLDVAVGAGFAKVEVGQDFSIYTGPGLTFFKSDDQYVVAEDDDAYIAPEAGAGYTRVELDEGFEITVGPGLEVVEVDGSVVVVKVGDGLEDVVSDNETVIADIPSYTLRVKKEGPGIVTVPLSKMYCGDQCVATYPAGTVVELTPTSAEGGEFTGWSDACDGSSCIVTMDADKNVTALFEGPAAQYEVNVRVSGKGTVTGEDIDCDDACSAIYEEGTELALFATPDPGLEFVRWQGACLHTDQSCSFVIGSNETARAIFQLQEDKTLTVNIKGDGSVYVPESWRGNIDKTYALYCSSSCQKEWNVGKSLSLRSTAAAGYAFKGWEGDCDEKSCYITMDEDKNVTAVFEKEPSHYTLTIEMEGDGDTNIFSSPQGEIRCGNYFVEEQCSYAFPKSEQVTLIAFEGSYTIFDGMTGDCSGKECLLTMNENKTLTLSSTQVARESITLDIGVQGYGSVGIRGSDLSISGNNETVSEGECYDCSVTFPKGDPISVWGIAGDGWGFDGWDGACYGEDNSYCTILSPTENMEVTAKFAGAYTLTVNKEGEGTVVSDPDGIDCGTSCMQALQTFAQSVTLTATAEEGIGFAGWEGACNHQRKSCTISPTYSNEIEVTATFETLPQVILKKEGTAVGAVISDYHYIECGENCRNQEAYFNPGVLTLFAYDAPGAAFLEWQGDCYLEENKCTIAGYSDDDSIEVTAVFAECTTDYHCAAADEACYGNECKEITCDCGYISAHYCYEYGCCDNNDCNEFQDCATFDRPQFNKCVEKPECFQIIDNGNSADKIDVVFVGDGYYDTEELEEDVVTLTQYYGHGPGDKGIFSLYPVSRHSDKFNIWIKTAPLISHDEEGRPDAGDIAQLVETCPRDFVAVLSQYEYRSYAKLPTTQFWGGTAYVSLLYGHEEDLPSILSHELGHSMVGLADEYEEHEKWGTGALLAPNCATDSLTAFAKWGSLEGEEDVGYYAGCSYVPTNIRPTENSIMRHHQEEGTTWGPVNEREWKKVLERYE